MTIWSSFYRYACKELESEILAILTAACLNYNIELTLTSEPAECSIEICACKTSLLLEL